MEASTLQALRIPGAHEANPLYTGVVDSPAKLDLLRRVFFDPDSLKPELTRERVTSEVAARLAGISEGMPVSF